MTIDDRCRYNEEGYCRLRFIKESKMQGYLKTIENECDFNESEYCNKYKSILEVEPSCLGENIYYH